MTVGARLYRVEQHLATMDKKMDQIMHALNGITHQRFTPSVVTPLQAASLTPLRLLEDDV